MDFVLGLVVASIVWGIIFVAWNLRVKYDGQLVVIRDDDGKTIMSLELDTDPEDIPNMEYIRLEVKKRIAK